MMTGMSEDREDIHPVLTVTPDARATVLEVLANESESETLALWLEISGESNGAYAYDMYFQALSPMPAAATWSSTTTTCRWWSPRPAWSGCRGRRSTS